MDLGEVLSALAAARESSSSHYSSPLGSGENDLSYSVISNQTIAVTWRSFGVHARITPVPRSQKWKVHMWAAAGHTSTASYWLSSTGYASGFLDPFHLLPYDKDLQDLVVACLDFKTPDATVYIAPHPWLNVLPETDTYARADAVLESLREAIVSFNISRSLAELSEALGGDTTLSASVTSDSLRVILQGECEGYIWTLTSGILLTITPPGAPPHEAWWKSDYGLVFEGYETPTDQELSQAIQSMFRQATPARWRYWFKEIHRGERLRYEPPLAILPDGTAVFPGAGNTAEEAYGEAQNFLGAWVDSDPARYSSKVRRDPLIYGGKGKKRYRKRGSKPRRDERIDLDPTPVHSDPRDYSAFLPPSQISWRERE